MRRFFKYRFFRWLLIALLAPYALALVYMVVPPPSTLMLADLATLHLPSRTWVPLREISPSLQAAVIASEDGAFCDHFGFDWGQIEKSVDKAMDGKKLRGASTITQQTAKNLFLWNGRSWLRKILEAPLTLWLELIWPKRRVLEVYLNIAQWGPHIYGAEAASRHYFGISARELTVRQSALLAAALPNPLKRNAAKPGAGQSIAASVIAQRVTPYGPDLSCLK